MPRFVADLQAAQQLAETRDAARSKWSPGAAGTRTNDWGAELQVWAKSLTLPVSLSLTLSLSLCYLSWWSQLSEAKRQISVNWTNWKCASRKKKYIKIKFSKRTVYMHRRRGTRPTLWYSRSYLQLQLCSLIIRFDGPVGLKHVSLRNRIHEVVLQGKPKRQQQNQHLQTEIIKFVRVAGAIPYRKEVCGLKVEVGDGLLKNRVGNKDKT